MPLSFEFLAVAKEPDDIQVSRMSSPKKQPVVRMPMKRRMATSANQMFFAPPPVEHTLRQRQELVMRTSMSEPTLKQRSQPMLPRIGTGRACGRIDEAFGRSGVVNVKPTFGSPSDLSRWQATSMDGTHSGNVGGTTLLTSIKPGHDCNVDAWCGLLSNDYRVSVPFSNFQEDDDKSDADAFVRWYNERESERSAQANRSRCPRPTKELMPWATERDVALVQAKAPEVGAGRVLRLLAKADLYDHLDMKGPLRGLEAMLEALAFRFDSMAEAIGALDSNGSKHIGLMEFAGSLGLLGLDLKALAGMEDENAFLGLDRDRDGLIRLIDFARLSKALQKKTVVKAKPIGKPKLGEEPVTMEELRLRPPEVEPDEVYKAMAKWSHIARWMSAAFQRSLALRTQRLLGGWVVKDKDRADSGAGDTFVTGAEKAADSSPSSLAREASSPSRHRTSSEPEPAERRPRRRPATSTPRELTAESLAAMQEKDFQLRALFNAAASQVLPDGTPEMTRADLHLFFHDLQLADPARHQKATAALLDKLYDEAIVLQCSLTRIGNGLTFWSMKVVLSSIIGPLGLSWKRLVEMAMAPEALEDASRAL